MAFSHLDPGGDQYRALAGTFSGPSGYDRGESHGDSSTHVFGRDAAWDAARDTYTLPCDDCRLPVAVESDEGGWRVIDGVVEAGEVYHQPCYDGAAVAS
ncbi:MAG: hypothetical protein JWN27_2950 [Candidatus Eremiobacteraeota bacterium]|nr:hypothetical protein [Candidatus Eremiobacteraeota bacterium]